ncbi:ImuA family protein [Foetidibacter luteolus]|uniref:ImuA family protein n=1 Tax=Foetidibacter luteolus TaxID=2608880 RepID=UPI001A99D4BA|nr:Error-prone repair protein ImuA [Foetidibacter luteolus]
MKSINLDIINRVKKDILTLQGFKTLPADNTVRIGIPTIEANFPNAVFPTGCMHEFISQTIEDAAATNAFVAALSGRLMQFGGACAWISATRTLFPSALKRFGLEPHQIIFIDLQKEKEVLFAMEEALKCNRLTTVIAEVKDVDFKMSRRFQLATEKSRVTGFILRHQPRTANTIACVSRWRISSIASEPQAGMPGVGFPRWNVALQKVRNGIPGNWQIEWAGNSFADVTKQDSKIISMPLLKVG